MRYLLVAQLFAVFFSIQAVAETSAELEAERLCEKTYGHAKDSGAFDRCVKQGSLEGAVSKDTQQTSGSSVGFFEALEEVAKPDPGVGNNCMGAADRELTAAERMCERYGYSRCSSEYETCVGYAEAEGADNGGKKKKKRR